MRRISTPTAAQDLFGPGKHGFRNGDPANAILATRLQAEWFNALQEEVATAVEQSGAALNPAESGQLSAAIEGVVDRRAPVATQAEAEESVEANANNTKRMTPLRVLQAIKARLINATELLVGMLRVGTQAEVNAGALDNVAVTPKKLRWGFSISLAANGYIVFPSWLGGLIIQWGQGNYSDNAIVTFPIAFTAGCIFVMAGDGTDSASTASNIAAWGVAQDTYSLTSFKIRTNAAGTRGQWFAIGN